MYVIEQVHGRGERKTKFLKKKLSNLQRHFSINNFTQLEIYQTNGLHRNAEMLLKRVATNLQPINIKASDVGRFSEMRKIRYHTVI